MRCMAIAGVIFVYGILQAKAQTAPQSSASSTGLSSQGMPGLIAIPSATGMPVGAADLSLNTWRNARLERGGREFKQWNLNFAVGMFSRFVVGGRGTEARPVDGGHYFARDLSANAQVLLLRESRYLPNAAVGIKDISGGAVKFRSRYAVATKSIGSFVRVTAGYGIGPQLLDGAFGGVEFSPSRYVSLLADYDARTFNAGVRLMPIPRTLLDAGFPRIQTDLIWSEYGGFSWGVTLRTPIDLVRRIHDGDPAAETAAVHASASESSTLASDRELDVREAIGREIVDRELVDGVQADLIDLGLENVRVSLQEDPARLTVDYENRRYNRNELDALVRVFDILAAAVPPRVWETRIILRQVGLPVLHVTVPTEHLGDLAARSMSREALASQVEIERPSGYMQTAPVRPAVTAERKNSTPGKLDVVVSPSLETIAFSEIGVAMARLNAAPGISVQLAPGMAVTARALLPVAESPGFPPFAPRFHINSALAHIAVPLPRIAPGVSGLTQFSGGRFSEFFVGWLNETVFTALQGRLLVGGKFGIQRYSLSNRDRVYAVGRARWHLPRTDTRIIVAAGQFHDKDRGYELDVARYFGDTEIGLFLRNTEAGALAGIRIALPLSPIKDMRPYPVRVRAPSLWGYEQRTLVFQDRNYLISDIARHVWSGHEIEGIYLNRDRLSEAYFTEFFSIRGGAR